MCDRTFVKLAKVDKSQPPGIRLERVFLRSAQFAHRSNPLEPLPEALRSPAGLLDIEIEIMGDEEGRVTIILRASNEPNDTHARYDFTAEMVGIFEPIVGEENMPTQEYAAKNGVALLFPFLRETVANLTSRGRFGPLWLNPANIQALLAPADQAATPVEDPLNRDNGLTT